MWLLRYNIKMQSIENKTCASKSNTRKVFRAVGHQLLGCQPYIQLRDCAESWLQVYDQELFERQLIEKSELVSKPVSKPGAWGGRGAILAPISLLESRVDVMYGRDSNLSTTGTIGHSARKR